jgi:hypothetical protein
MTPRECQRGRIAEEPRGRATNRAQQIIEDPIAGFQRCGIVVPEKSKVVSGQM